MASAKKLKGEVETGTTVEATLDGGQIEEEKAKKDKIKKLAPDPIPEPTTHGSASSRIAVRAANKAANKQEIDPSDLAPDDPDFRAGLLDAALAIVDELEDRVRRLEVRLANVEANKAGK